MKIVIVGAGPAGLFAAKTLSKNFEVVVIEKNSFVGGAGLHSDGKLNFHPKIGGDLTEFMSESEAWQMVKFIEKTFETYGAPVPKFDEEKVKEVERLSLKAGIKFIPIRQSHIGSDFLPQVVGKFKKELESNGVKFLLETEMKDVKIENGKIKSIITDKGEISGDHFLFALGRSSFDWFNNFIIKNNLNFIYNPIDVGVRVEVPNEIFDWLTKDIGIWDPKFHIRTKSYDDFVRTFCTNPSGFVVKDYYGDSIFGVNGHAMKTKKSKNTNFAFLVRVNLTEPLENTTLYGKHIAKLVNTLGGGKPILQRLGDLINNRRSTETRIKRSFVEPTLTDVTPGDISIAYPQRIVVDLIEGLEKLDKIIPGIFSDHTLLYAPEIKFYALRLKTTKNLISCDIPNLSVAGDGAGVSRGIVAAAATGIIAAKGITEKYSKV